MTGRLRRIGLATAIAAGLLFPAGCADDADSLYASFPAFFSFNAVHTTQPLFSALTNPGQFCAITFPNGRYVFRDADGLEVSYPSTAVQQYAKPRCVAGFIVGTPAVPDLSGSTIVAYDLVCPNCYSDNALTRALTFASTTTMNCGRCGRVYDLNNAGIVTSGTGGRALYRYHVAYASATGAISITN